MGGGARSTALPRSVKAGAWAQGPHPAPVNPQFVTPELLSEMRSRPVLEVDAGALVRRIRVLLGKMSRVVNLLTPSDLESFLEATSILLVDNTSLAEKFRSRVEAATTLAPGSH